MLLLLLKVIQLFVIGCIICAFVNVIHALPVDTHHGRNLYDRMDDHFLHYNKNHLTAVGIKCRLFLCQGNRRKSEFTHGRKLALIGQIYVVSSEK